MELLLSGYSRLLVRFSFRQNNTFCLPFSKDVPMKEVRQTQRSGPTATGQLILERHLVDAEFLPDFLREEGFFLQKFHGESLVVSGRAALFFEYGRKEKRVRNVKLTRETQIQLLGEAVWGMRVYKNPDSESFPLCINFACRTPYFAPNGELLKTRPQFVLQKESGLIVVKSVLEHQISAA